MIKYYYGRPAVAWKKDNEHLSFGKLVAEPVEAAEVSSNERGRLSKTWEALNDGESTYPNCSDEGFLKPEIIKCYGGSKEEGPGRLRIMKRHLRHRHI